MIRNKIFIIVTILLLVVLSVSIFPWVTSFEMEVDMVKLDEDGREAGTFTILLQGNLANYLFRKDQLELRISELDDLSKILVSHEVQIADSPVYDNLFCRVSGSASNTSKNEVEYVDIGFDEDMDRWVICPFSGDICYVGSVSGVYSAQELAAYFKGLTPLQWFYDS